jgi:hypothetical protein
MVSFPNPSLCRVSLHADADAGAIHVDLALPAGVPIGALIPSVVDILASRGGGQRAAEIAASYRLSPPGAAALDSSKTLAQHAIRDGALLLLTRATAELPVPRFDDPAEQMSATVRAKARPWTPRATRLTSVLVAVGLAAMAGFVAVPGGPGAPNALLAATAAAAVSVLAIHLTGCGGPIMTAVCCLAVLAAVAALAVVLTGVSPHVIGALAAAASIGLLQGAGRISIALAGLSQRPGPPSAGQDDRTILAHDLLTGLVAAFSAAAALGVGGAAVGVHTGGAARFGGIALAAVTGAALLLRAGSHTDRSQIAALVVGGIAALSVSLATAAGTLPQHPLWLGATAAALAGATVYLGFAAPVLSPVTRRGIELLEYLALAAVVPLACWICGCYGAARGLSLT